MSVSPFDDDEGGFFMLVNDDRRHSLSPAFAGVPTGWRVVHGTAYPVRLSHVERNWTDIRSERLRGRLAISESVLRGQVAFGGLA